MQEDRTFNHTWSFKPHWFETTCGKMHYIDEGDPNGEPIVLIHGNPTWGYLYRHYIQPLVNAGYRCIVPDYLGFGLSDELPNIQENKIHKHAQRFSDLMAYLSIDNVTLILHDWGGPTGGHWAAKNPHKIKRL